MQTIFWYAGLTLVASGICVNDGIGSALIFLGVTVCATVLVENINKAIKNQ